MAKFFVLSVLLVTSFCVGCGNPVQPQPPPVVNNSVSQFYTPLSTALKYNYAHFDKRGPAFADSNYVFTYQGIGDPTAIDGFGPVNNYLVSDAMGSATSSLESYAYVSDSEIIEYGSNCHSADTKLIVLKAPLDSGASWIAASNYLTPDGRRVTITARVEKHLESYGIGIGKATVDYPNAWPISYYVTGPDAADPNAEFQNGSRHRIFFGNGQGRLEEYSYAPNARLLWSNELQSVVAR